MAGKESVTKLANNEEKKKALDAAIAKLEKDFGKGAVMRLGESGADVAVERRNCRIYRCRACTGSCIRKEYRSRY